MKVFDAYAKYYDLLYRDKDYKKETDYIVKFIKKYKPDTKSVLDLGCGTGRHDLILSQNGFDTTGVELSPEMYSVARKMRNQNANKDLALRFYKGDIRKIRLLNKYDVIISLFHVLNYQTTNKDIDLVFQTVKKHLKKDGLFIFDFWYGPAVLSDRPVKRTRIMNDEDIVVKRKTVPDMRINENIAVINFEVEVKDKKTKQTEKFKETHNMRYLFLPELEAICENNKFKNIHSEEWMSGKTLSDKTWYGLTVLRNQNQ